MWPYESVYVSIFSHSTLCCALLLQLIVEINVCVSESVCYRVCLDICLFDSVFALPTDVEISMSVNIWIIFHMSCCVL